METNFTTQTTGQAWHRIMISFLFGFIFFWVGIPLNTQGFYFLSNLLFIMVGVMVYLLLDAFIFFAHTGRYGVQENKIFVVGSVFGFLLNLIVFAGFALIF